MCIELDVFFFFIIGMLSTRKRKHEEYNHFLRILAINEWVTAKAGMVAYTRTHSHKCDGYSRLQFIHSSSFITRQQEQRRLQQAFRKRQIAEHCAKKLSALTRLIIIEVETNSINLCLRRIWKIGFVTKRLSDRWIVHWIWNDSVRFWWDAFAVSVHVRLQAWSRDLQGFFQRCTKWQSEPEHICLNSAIVASLSSSRLIIECIWPWIKCSLSKNLLRLPSQFIIYFINKLRMPGKFVEILEMNDVVFNHAAG